MEYERKIVSAPVVTVPSAMKNGPIPKVWPWPAAIQPPTLMIVAELSAMRIATIGVNSACSRPERQLAAQRRVL